MIFGNLEFANERDSRFFVLLERVLARFENNPYAFVGVNTQKLLALQECKQKVALGLRVQKCILIELETQKAKEVLAQALEMEEFFTAHKITLTLFLRAPLAQFSCVKLPNFLRLCVLRA